MRRGPVPPELRENKDLMGIFTPLWFADLRYGAAYVVKVERAHPNESVTLFCCG